ncbi:MAG: aspartate/glutamate racemase family protein [Leptotrichiaceae bacterium]|nr:aspartate/glutamate racemase family protein [Leptotrichiaceae bacterium]MBP6281580.1 aspartate/glutamate racemase family protein [Leptotrichiaceae bacterium]MBP7101268.1 aspartate/glutamate racemase family protein [Leptotrichiaceae bacterium]MBP7739658.1 aspartate/glutamate racemase family protein [Leptotrichiaceae bacterium]MBP9630422.1 aspartate/glutamate racemase family protein [Leptotrichiaceae bacterium]
MKIAVMAGTPIDTKMGVSLLYKNDFNEILDIPISRNPSEQTIFQVSNREYKEKIINNHIDNIKEQNCNVLFVYCNSLSSSLDFNEIAKTKNIRIITPMDIYVEISKKYKKIGIISANAQGLAGIEKVMFQTNENIEIVGITLLEMVKEIEKCENVKKISEKFDFLTLIKYFNAMKVDAIVVGCTHFPYVKEEFKKLTNIEILDPGIKMIEKI